MNHHEEESNYEAQIFDDTSNTGEEQLLAKWQLSLEHELYLFKLALMGIQKNPNFGLTLEDGTEDFTQFIKIVGAALVNERGATAIHNKLQAELTKIPADTKLTEDVIVTEIMAFETDFSFWTAVNSVDYGISDKDYNTICEECVRLIKSQWYRSLGGWKGTLVLNNIKQQQIIRREHDVEVPSGGRNWGFFKR